MVWNLLRISGFGVPTDRVSTCQEIGLVASMFLFELLFSYVSLIISFYVSLTNSFSIAHFPI